MKWTDLTPTEARFLDLSQDLSITAPLNEQGERCPWPWDPQRLVHAPIGQFHCRYCGAMVVAGLPHLDYATEDREVTPESLDSIVVWLITNEAVVHCDTRFYGSGRQADPALKFMTRVSDWQDVRFGDTLCLGLDGFSVKRKET